MLSRLYSDYAIFLVLLVLGAFFSFATWTEQAQRGAAGGTALAQDIARQLPLGRFLVVVRDVPEDSAFADAIQQTLTKHGWTDAGSARGHPADAKKLLDQLENSGTTL